MCLAFLLPLAVTNLRSGFANELYGADASLDAAGATRVPVSTTMAQELWRRSPRKGAARTLLDPWSAALRSDGLAEADDEIDPGDLFVDDTEPVAE